MGAQRLKQGPPRNPWVSRNGWRNQKRGREGRRGGEKFATQGLGGMGCKRLRPRCPIPSSLGGSGWASWEGCFVGAGPDPPRAPPSAAPQAFCHHQQPRSCGTRRLKIKTVPSLPAAKSSAGAGAVRDLSRVGELLPERPAPCLPQFPHPCSQPKSERRRKKEIAHGGKKK